MSPSDGLQESRRMFVKGNCSFTQLYRAIARVVQGVLHPYCAGIVVVHVMAGLESVKPYSPNQAIVVESEGGHR